MLCSDSQDRNECIDYMCKKFVDSGYIPSEIYFAKEKALKLDHNLILNADKSNTQTQKEKQLTFVMNRNRYMAGKIRGILKENQSDIDTLLGERTRLVVAERRGQNTASMLFAKASFSREVIEEGEDQECGGSSDCLTYKLMKLNKELILWKNDPGRETKIKLDFRCDCTSVNIIYIFVCKLCPNNRGFYVGQTVTQCRTRVSGHRGKFTIADYSKSALSCHVYRDHPDQAHNKLNNFYLGVIRSASPNQLDRLEDFYVDFTKAELSLNRYKVTVR